MASFGIHGVVLTYAELPDPAKLDLSTVYLVRTGDGAPEGDGLYWVVKESGVRVWRYFDDLSLQDAGEVGFDDTTAGLGVGTVQEAIEALAASGGDHPYAAPAGHGAEDWGAVVPLTMNDAVARIAAMLRQHTGVTIPEVS